MVKQKKVIYFKSGTYLPMTQNWIYTQLEFLHHYSPTFYCFGEENLANFPIQKIHNFGHFRYSQFGINSNMLLAYNFLLRHNPIILCHLLKERPKLVHAHFGFSGYDLLGFKKIYNFPLLTSFYGEDMSRLPNTTPIWRDRIKALFRQGDFFTSMGNHMTRTLISLGCPSSKIIPSPLGIDMAQVVFKQRNPKSTALKILIAARFTEKKGIPYAIKAIGALKRASPSLQITTTLIGDSGNGRSDKKEKKLILQEIKASGLFNKLKILGNVPHDTFIGELYNHDVFLSPSITASDGDTEASYPLTIVEASASGMPVLSTNHCDINEVIIHKKSGLLSAERDSQQLTKSLFFLATHPWQITNMGIAGREHIEQRYNARKLTNNLERYYDKISQK
ncbi:MAG: glycosyltransferase [Patescibacteria group bacterium]|nr:glycosyltransferase [Patescibacteria group bacterium]